MKQLKITQKKSLIGRRADHRRTVKALGLRRINHSVVQNDTPQIRGMIHKVDYLLAVEEVKAKKGKSEAAAGKSKSEAADKKGKSEAEKAKKDKSEAAAGKDKSEAATGKS